MENNYKKILSLLRDILLKYPYAVAATIFLILIAIAMAAAGEQFQIGGLLAKLWGKKEPDVRKLPPENRTDDLGNPIQPGKSDKKGYVQAPVELKIVEPTIFSNPNVVVVKHPEDGKKEIPLPKGVINKDVAEVILVKPHVYEIKNNDKGLKVTSLVELLK